MTEPRREEVIRNTIPMSHMVSPVVAITDRGAYIVHPELAVPCGMKKLASMQTPPRKNDQ